MSSRSTAVLRASDAITRSTSAGESPRVASALSTLSGAVISSKNRRCTSRNESGNPLLLGRHLVLDLAGRGGFLQHARERRNVVVPLDQGRHPAEPGDGVAI